MDKGIVISKNDKILLEMDLPFCVPSKKNRMTPFISKNTGKMIKAYNPDISKKIKYIEDRLESIKLQSGYDIKDVIFDKDIKIKMRLDFYVNDERIRDMDGMYATLIDALVKKKYIYDDAGKYLCDVHTRYLINKKMGFLVFINDLRNNV